MAAPDEQVTRLQTCPNDSTMIAMRKQDGSAGDADYGAIGTSYARFRQPDPRIGAHIPTAHSKPPWPR